MSDATPATDTITVNRQALFEILKALEGPGHLVRELQAIRNIQGVDSPISILINEYNAAMEPKGSNTEPEAA